MGLGSTISRNPSVAGSSIYERSHRTSSGSSTVHSALRSASSIYESSAPQSRSSSTLRATLSRASTSASTSKPSTVRASTVTSATSMSKLMRSASTASTSRESSSASLSSTVRPPTVASRTSKNPAVRDSTATSTSKLIRSASTASTLRPLTSTPASSTTSLLRSTSKRAPSHFLTTASRILWGRPPPSHSTLQPSQIAALTHTLSLPVETPMLSSVVGALGVPLSRSQFSPTPSCFCNAHFWFEQKYIDELTEVITHEIGPQLDKLRIAPRELISRKTERLLSTLQPHQDILTSTTDTSSILSMEPTCPACTLSHFFQNPAAVNALTLAVKGRKHRAHPWPASMAWLDPCPGREWEAKWRSEGKSVAHDRVRVQRWRRETRAHERVPDAPPPVLGHQPGEGCDFCDALRMERADEAELDAAIAEEEEEGADKETRAVGEPARYSGAADGIDDDDDDDASGSETLRSDSSTTLRAMEEESIIKGYLRPPTATTDSACHPRPVADDLSGNKAEQEARRRSSVMGGYLAHRGGRGEGERARGASDWARSYQCLVGRNPDSQTTLLFERYSEPGLRAVEGWI